MHQSVIDHVTNMNGRILWVPGGCSPERQPADATYHGVIHSAISKAYMDEYLFDANSEPSHADALRYYVKARAKVPRECVQRGFVEAAAWDDMPAVVMLKKLRDVPSSSSSSSITSPLFTWPANQRPSVPKRRTAKQKAAARPAAGRAASKPLKLSKSFHDKAAAAIRAEEFKNIDSKHSSGDTKRESKYVTDNSPSVAATQSDDVFTFPGMLPPTSTSSSAYRTTIDIGTTGATLSKSHSTKRQSSLSLPTGRDTHATKRRKNSTK
jgi:hypothetical protein